MESALTPAKINVEGRAAGASGRGKTLGVGIVGALLG